MFTIIQNKAGAPYVKRIFTFLCAIQGKHVQAVPQE